MLVCSLYVRRHLTYGHTVQYCHRCLAIELQQFNILRRSMNEVIRKFLWDGLQPVESIIVQNRMIEGQNHVELLFQHCFYLLKYSHTKIIFDKLYC